MKVRVPQVLLAMGAGTGAVIASLAAALPVAAAPLSAKVYVAPNASAQASGNSCTNAKYSSISDGINAVRIGGEVIVCKGTYPGGITVNRSVRLEGRLGATVDATGMAYGIGVAASYSTVSGFTVKNASDMSNGAPADGIVTAGFGPNGPVAADHVRIMNNVLTGNMGAGIDLNSTSYSYAVGNVAKDNGIGVNVSNDLNRPAAHNKVLHNVTNENFGGCGIALADHTGTGVHDNWVAFNVSNDNGLSTPTAPDASAGSGVILASPIPGGKVYNNTISHNTFSGNGHAGVVLHAHAPGTNFSGNRIAWNLIGTNNLRTDTSDTQTTGIYLGSVSPLTIAVAGNVIRSNHFGIFTAGDVTITGQRNHFVKVTVPMGHVASYITAPESHP